MIVTRLVGTIFTEYLTFAFEPKVPFSDAALRRIGVEPHYPLPGRHGQYVGHGIVWQSHSQNLGGAAARHHAGANISDQIFPLHGRVDNAFVSPGEFQIVGAEQVADHMVAEALDPGEDRQQSFLVGDVLLRLAGGAIHLIDEVLRRDGKGETDDAGDPFVEAFLSSGSLVWMKVRATPPGRSFVSFAAISQ